MNFGIKIFHYCYSAKRRNMRLFRVKTNIITEILYIAHFHNCFITAELLIQLIRHLLGGKNLLVIFKIR